mgnify:CR=1 FL=1
MTKFDAELLLDTKILLRYMSQDRPDHSARAAAFMEAIASGGVVVFVLNTVVFETVFLLEKQYRRTRTWICEAITRILALQAARVERRAEVALALGIYTTTNLRLADAFHAAITPGDDLAGIASFDRGLDRVPVFAASSPDLPVSGGKTDRLGRTRHRQLAKVVA